MSLHINLKKKISMKLIQKLFKQNALIEHTYKLRLTYRKSSLITLYLMILGIIVLNNKLIYHILYPSTRKDLLIENLCVY